MLFLCRLKQTHTHTLSHTSFFKLNTASFFPEMPDTLFWSLDSLPFLCYYHTPLHAHMHTLYLHIVGIHVASLSPTMITIKAWNRKILQSKSIQIENNMGATIMWQVKRQPWWCENQKYSYQAQTQICHNKQQGSNWILCTSANKNAGSHKSQNKVWLC